MKIKTVIKRIQMVTTGIANDDDNVKHSSDNDDRDEKMLKRRKMDSQMHFTTKPHASLLDNGAARDVSHQYRSNRESIR